MSRSTFDRPQLTRSRILVFVLVIAAAASVFAFRPRPGPSVPIDQLFAVSLYAGSGACAGCHRRESEQFAETVHARALCRADGESVAAHLIGRAAPEPLQGQASHPRIEYGSKDGRLWATDLSSVASNQLPIEWCFGSGAQGTTFVTVLRDRHGRSRLLEHHWSWFQDGDVLAITPGHAPNEAARGYEIFGEVYEPSMTRMCFSCHATAFRYDAGRLDSGSVVPGVQCERCHAPRKEHVQMRLAEREPGRMASRTPRPAREQVYACGECHRRPDEIDDPIRPDNPLIARFPSVGMVQSKCFLATEESGTLRCTTCHDPHLADRPPASSYNSRCRECHDPRRNRVNVPCSAEPDATSCLGCHMPKVNLHEHLNFTDHWIRIPRR